MSARTTTTRDALVGIGGIGGVIAIVWLCLALYSQQFHTFVPVTVYSERTGLLMDPGADVKLRGVVVGHVGSVSADGRGARLGLELDPELVERVPADAAVSIVPPTAFGAKYVELKDVSRGGDPPAIRAGQVISGARVNVEVNQTFDSARQALDRVDPVKLNATLTYTADMLRGQGDDLGTLIRSSNTLSEHLADQMPNVAASTHGVDHLARSYQQTVPDMVTTMANTGDIVENLYRHETQLSGTLTSVMSMSHTLTDLLLANESALRKTSSVYIPTTQLLSEYAPSYRCTLEGVAVNDRLLSAIMGGPEFGGSHRNAHVTFMAQRALAPYKYPQDLPKVAAASGPDCQGLPNVSGNVPFRPFDTGANPYPSDQDGIQINNPPLSLILFGQSIPEEKR